MGSFNTHTATIAAAQPRQPDPYKQAVRIQRRLFDATNDEEITPSALAQVARAWSEIEDRKRVMKMKPAPKPVDVTVARRAPKARHSHEPSENP